MKKILALFVGVAMTSGIVNAQDSLYIYRDGIVICKRATSMIDSIVFHKVILPPITYGSVTDIESNIYKTIALGSQTWMAENLKVTKYNDGTTIPNETSETAWIALTTGASCAYNNTTNIDTIKTNGRLYNWFAVNTGKLCPTGWNVPNDTEWTALQTYLIAGGYNFDGTTTDDKIAKSMASTSGWNTSSQNGSIGHNPSLNNRSGYSSVPSGKRDDNGSFVNIGSYGYWWSSTETAAGIIGNYWSLFFDSKSLSNFGTREFSGFSVRCIKD
ncbi:MAG: hypothetical protein AUK31_05255 [Fibrobacteres bacterium CG2_30_45_31]|nr:MAG: hypothetical protein AUK31_05255 [Fibrobacteres bacterium CG2_30_45_31]